MNQCVLIHFKGDFSNQEMRDFMLKTARTLSLEGIAQLIEVDTVKIVTCGKKENIEQFIDALHKSSGIYQLTEIVIEPFYKQKEYRGVFRIIE